MPGTNISSPSAAKSSSQTGSPEPDGPTTNNSCGQSQELPSKEVTPKPKLKMPWSSSHITHISRGLVQVSDEMMMWNNNRDADLLPVAFHNRGEKRKKQKKLCLHTHTKIYTDTG